MNVLLAENPEAETDLSTSTSLLAWTGWQLEMPGEWRPLKIYGTAKKGWMIVGDALCALFSIHWQRPGRRAIRDGHEWVEGRLKRQGLIADASPPAASQFTACTWARDAETEEGKKTTFWYGYDEYANLLLGIKVNGVLPQEELDQIIDGVLPTLRAAPLNSDQTWALHDVNFDTPEGFELYQRHLYAGDVALELLKGRRELLLVRQVYPGDLALERRPFERWLAKYPFKEHRRLRKRSVVTAPWQHPTNLEIAGIRRRGFKRLGFPMGFIVPRFTSAIIAHDRELNRLLIVEHMAANEADDTMVERVICNMNSYLREGGRVG